MCFDDEWNRKNGQQLDIRSSWIGSNHWRWWWSFVIQPWWVLLRRDQNRWEIMEASRLQAKWIDESQHHQIFEWVISPCIAKLQFKCRNSSFDNLAAPYRLNGFRLCFFRGTEDDAEREVYVRSHDVSVCLLPRTCGCSNNFFLHFWGGRILRHGLWIVHFIHLGDCDELWFVLDVWELQVIKRQSKAL